MISAFEQLLANNHGTAVIYLDIDDFKPVNDQLGHATGDQLLIHFADRLRKLSRQHDPVARLGGDEFLLVCHGPELPARAAATADRVHRALDHPFALPPARSTSMQASASPAPGLATQPKR